MRLWAYQSIAHGADGMLHFRWRTCRFGAETYWCGILDHDNVPRRRYREFSQEGRELKALGPRLLGTVLDVEAAVLIESEQDEAHRTLSMGLPSPTDVGWACYAELLRRHLPCGLVDARDSLAGLRLVVLPSFPLMDPGLCERLRAFVEGGGVLVVTARSAVRDRDNQAPAGVTPPWLLSELTGARVAEFGRLEPGAVCLADAREGEKPVPAGAGYEVLELDPGTEAVARWLPFEDGRPFAAAGAPAISRRCLGKGTVFQVGTFVDAGNVAAVLAPALAVAGLRPLAEAEPVVEVTRRRSADRVFAFVLNHDHRPQRVTGLGVGTEALTETPITDQIELPGWGVAVVEGR
jgi:beta-galactosidase